MTEHASTGGRSASGDGRSRGTRRRVAVAAGVDGAERIVETVPEAYDVSSAPVGPTGDVDLWIVDEPTVEQCASFATGGRPATAVLLVVDDADLPPERWEQIDDIVTRPLHPRALGRRIENLLTTDRGDVHRHDDGVIALERLGHPAVAADVRDGTRLVTTANGAFEDTFGYDTDALVGTALSEWIVPPDARENARELVRRATDREFVERVVRRETTTGRRDFRVRMVDCPGSGPDLFVGFEDVTDERCREQQVQVLNRVLRHNLRNGTNVILGNAELLVESVDEQHTAAAAREIRDAARELVELGETASYLQGPESGGQRRLLDAVALVGRVRTTLQRSSRRAGISVDAPPSCPVVADARLETAVRELCENALQYAVDDQRPVTVAVRREGDWTKISVSDRGPGLPDAERAVLRGDEETPLEHGSGLGLWIVNWIVTGLGGEIDVTDGDANGTTVTLSLPATPRRPDRIPNGHDS